jgi:hypothetical protein
MPQDNHARRLGQGAFSWRDRDQRRAFDLFIKTKSQGRNFALGQSFTVSSR